MRPLLLAVAFLDELASGVSPVASPELRDGFGLTDLGAAGATIVALSALSLVEPALLLAAERQPRRWFLCGGLVGIAVSYALAAWAPSFGVLIAALALYGPSSGCAVALANASLADEAAGERERAMARWALFANAGDLATLGLVSLLAMFGLGTRAAFLVCGVWALLHALALWRALGARGPASGVDVVGGDEPGAPGVWRGAREALRNRSLLAWAGAALLCTLLDEILVAFGALYMTDRLHADVHRRGVVLAAWMIGGVGGLALLERYVSRLDPLRVLAATCAVGGAAYASWLQASSIEMAAACAFIAGACCATHHPIATAQAYAALPGRSATVGAVQALFTPLELALPLVLGVVATRAGIGVAMALLALQPLGILLVTAWALRRRARQSVGGTPKRRHGNRGSIARKA